MDAYLQRQICQRIKQARRASGLTQEDAANLLNVTARAYQNYERDRVPFRSLGKIASLFGVTQDWLLRGDQETQPQALREAVADALAELERSQENAHGKLDEVLQRLARLEGLLSRPEVEPRGP